MSMYPPFRASVSPRALDKASLLFNSTFSDAFSEAFQNSRRGGATRIDVTTSETETGGEVTIRDDGCGIADPRTLLTLGGSDWDKDIQQAESPAGMGFWSLANRGVRIASRHRSHGQGWFIELSTDHFNGRADVVVHDCDVETGTVITFAFEPGEHPDRAAEGAALHCPVPVFLNGARLEQKPFLDGALHVETWKGIRIGVFKRQPWSGDPTINFHGLTLKTALPCIGMAMGQEAFSARLDIVDCPDLRLVLPARKEVVQDAFFRELQIAVKRALYRTIAREGAHRLAFASWREARSLGIELPEALPELWPFVPDTADTTFREARNPVPVPGSGCLVAFDGEPPEQQCFWRAVRKNGLDLPLFEPCPAYEGYSWYDALPRITGMRCFAVAGGEAAEVVLTEEAGENARPDRIEIEATLRAPDGSARTLGLDTDLLMTGDPWNVYVEDVRLFVTRDSDLTPGDLASLLEAAYFSHSDDACADSYETQIERFRDEARHAAVTFLLSREEANIALLTDAIRRDLLWLIPRDRETVITIKGCDIHIEQTPSPEAEDGRASTPAGRT